MKTMIIDWQESLLKDRSITPNAKYIGMYLRTFMNAKNDMAWPSLARISDETGLSRATVCRHLKILDEAGWISRNKGSLGKNTEYTATYPDSLNLETGSLTERLGGESGSPTERLGSVRERLEVVSERDTNNQVNNQVINNRGKTTLRENHDPVMTPSAKPMQDKIRLDKNRIDKGEKTKRFTPPTVEEVSKYVATRKVKIDPQKFVDHYEGTGWMRGKNKIKNWQACVRTWEGNQSNNVATKQNPRSVNMADVY